MSLDENVKREISELIASNEVVLLVPDGLTPPGPPGTLSASVASRVV